ncbi:site-specific integrase [Frigoribacterium sp. Leaf164]|uniref:tyrosine-type recombinase/integrase n=1 Tax=Frigoribacterium sp. Leaf164 TaxID=1736282 RepID=UPI0009E9BE1A|nr:site-specific integrase [Frigoribacterium sp. Leaf164]
MPSNPTSSVAPTPPNRRRRRKFGNVRKTSAGRFQARYPSPDGSGVMVPGPTTFRTQKEADAFLNRTQVEIEDNHWKDPRKKAPTLAAYIPHFQRVREGRGGGPIKPRTRELSESQFKNHILPTFGDKPLDEITTHAVNAWFSSLPERPTLRRQCYSLLKALLNLAIREEQIRGANPCRLKSAGQNKYDERPYFSLGQVEPVIALLPPHIRVVALVAFNAHLRLGEVLALRCSDIDLDRARVRVARGVTETASGQYEGQTKTASQRFIDVDRETVQLLIQVLHNRDPLADERLFRRPDKSVLRHQHVQRAWSKARLAAGLPALHFHDLRHVGLTMMAETGAPLSVLKHRAGHGTVQAAMNYQHRAAERGPQEAELFAKRKWEERQRARLEQQAAQPDGPDEDQSS